MFTIHAPFFPISFNQYKSIFRNRMIKTKKARAYEKQLHEFLIKNYAHLINHKFNTSDLRLVYRIGSSRFITAKGLRNKRSGDIDGFLKCTIDIIFKTLLPELDDSQIIRMNVELYVSENDQFSFSLIETSPLES